MCIHVSSMLWGVMSAEVDTCHLHVVGRQSATGLSICEHPVAKFQKIAGHVWACCPQSLYKFVATTGFDIPVSDCKILCITSYVFPVIPYITGYPHQPLSRKHGLQGGLVPIFAGVYPARTFTFLDGCT